MYPEGPQTPEIDNMGQGPSETCLDCLDENAIAQKWNEIKNIPWTGLRNCAWFTWQLLEAGSVGLSNSICFKNLKNTKCPCTEFPICRNQCSAGTGIFYHPLGTEKYLKCLKTNGCDPFTPVCYSPSVF
jgi:hypothetical protein